MQATKRPRVQREPETQANNHAYAPGLCFAAWAGWPCTSDCMSSAGAANKGGTDSCCVDGHCCRLGADFLARVLKVAVSATAISPFLGHLVADLRRATGQVTLN